MKIKFYNARILTAENDCSIINGEIHIDGDKIRYVGEEKNSHVTSIYNKITGVAF